MAASPRQSTQKDFFSPQPVLLRQRSYQERSCWVCFGTDDDDVAAEWVHPCRCRGTTMWVHQECLQRWVDEKQNGSAATSVSCPQCRTRYRIDSPSLSSVLQAIDEAEKLIDAISPLATAGALVGCVYWCATSYGALAVFQVLGLEGGSDVLKQMDPLVLGFVLPLIPSALIGARFINWQLYGLQAWRKYWPVLKGWMGYESSEGNRRRSEPQRKPAQVNKPGADAVSMSRIVIGALALPSCAALLGYTMYGNLVESYTKRSLLGGLTFVLAKGIVKMYYQEQQYIRQSNRRILDYPI